MPITGSQQAPLSARAGVARVGAIRSGFLTSIWTNVVMPLTSWAIVR